MKQHALTYDGLREIESFIAECRAFRKELLDGKADTCLNTSIPNTAEIIKEFNTDVTDDDDCYMTCYGVTDHESLYLILEKGVHYC